MNDKPQNPPLLNYESENINLKEIMHEQAEIERISIRRKKN